MIENLSRSWAGLGQRAAASAQARRVPLISCPGYRVRDGEDVARRAGEARTKAMVEESGGDDAVFEALAEPAGLLMENVIRKHVPEHGAERAELLRAARELRLPKNPLVSGALAAALQTE